jgi:hypothetical protein
LLCGDTRLEMLLPSLETQAAAPDQRLTEQYPFADTHNLLKDFVQHWSASQAQNRGTVVFVDCNPR